MFYMTPEDAERLNVKNHEIVTSQREGAVRWFWWWVIRIVPSLRPICISTHDEANACGFKKEHLDGIIKNKSYEQIKVGKEWKI